MKRIILGSMEKVFRTLARSEEETVGIVLGVSRLDEVSCMALFRVENRLSSPYRFEADHWQIVQAHETAKKYGLEVVALFHSHPSCPAEPSSLDVEGMRRWSMPWIIACRDEIRGWSIEEGRVVEVEVV